MMSDRKKQIESLERATLFAMTPTCTAKTQIGTTPEKGGEVGMNVNEMSASQIIGQLNMMFDWKRRPHEGKFLQRAIELLKEQETTNTGEARIFQCKKCGYGFDDIFLIDERNYDIEPNYCPNCGRSVLKEQGTKNEG